MKISEQGLSLIKQFEGFRSTDYPDLAGHQTVGYGHKLLPGQRFTTAITEDQAEDLLQDDLVTPQSAVNAYVSVPLTQGQFDALVDFAFNLGSGTLRGATLLHLLNQGNYMAAADQFLLWDHSGGTVVPGLLRRRQAERDLFLKG